MKKLIGTEKQIKWAEDIRNNFLNAIEKVQDERKEILDYIMEIEQAKEFIDIRDLTLWEIYNKLEKEEIEKTAEENSIILADYDKVTDYVEIEATEQGFIAKVNIDREGKVSQMEPFKNNFGILDGDQKLAKVEKRLARAKFEEIRENEYLNTDVEVLDRLIKNLIYDKINVKIKDEELRTQIEEEAKQLGLI